MDFQRLKTFQTVAALLNFNQAARALHYAQSSVSAQIKALEEEFGVSFFNRVGKRISLTEAGEKMLKYADRILAIGKEAMADVNGRAEQEGVLSLRVPQTVATYYLPHILADFQPRYPKVRLDVSSCAFLSLENELRIGTIDAAFLLTESVQSAALYVEATAVERLLVVAGSMHPLARRGRIGFRDLASCSVFLPKSDCGYRMSFEHALAEKGVKSVMIMDFNSIAAIKECVKIGLGVTVIPEIAVREELKKGELIALSWEEELETAVLMIRHKERWVSPILEAFLDSVRAVVPTVTK